MKTEEMKKCVTKVVALAMIHHDRFLSILGEVVLYHRQHHLQILLFCCLVSFLITGVASKIPDEGRTSSSSSTTSTRVTTTVCYESPRITPTALPRSIGMKPCNLQSDSIIRALLGNSSISSSELLQSSSSGNSGTIYVNSWSNLVDNALNVINVGLVAEGSLQIENNDVNNVLISAVAEDLDGAVLKIAESIAKLMDVNPKLTYTDVQHILVESATCDQVNNEMQVNSDGKCWSERLGFGIVNADLAVQLAENWELSYQQVIVKKRASYQTEDAHTIHFTTNIDHDLIIDQLDIQLDDRYLANGIAVQLISPSGTLSIMNQITNSRTTVRQFWGESARGEWQIKLTSSSSITTWRTDDVLSLEMHGSPNKRYIIIPEPTPSPLPSESTPKHQWISKHLRTLITVSLLSAGSLLIGIIVLVRVIQMYNTKEGECEVDSAIWNEMMQESVDKGTGSSVEDGAENNFESDDEDLKL